MNPFTILLQCIAGLDPEIKAKISARLDKMQAAAKETKLPFDDIGVALLRFATGL